MTKIYDPYEMKLANEIADTLGDRDALPLFLQYTKTFTEEFLRKKLQKVMSIPDSKIRKSRGALFTFLINQHKRGNDEGSRH